MKKLLFIGIVGLLSSCMLFTFRTITLSSENETYNIPQHERYVYITPLKEDPIITIKERKINNVLAYYFSQNGWKIVNNKQNTKYVLGWIQIGTQNLNTSYIPQYGDTTISSINTYSTGSGNYAGTSSIYGNTINTYGNLNYSGNTYSDIQYNQGIVGYTPISIMQYMEVFAFYLVDMSNKQIVYSFALGVSDYSTIKDSDLIAYLSWSLKNRFWGTNGENENLDCDIDGQKIKCN